MRTTSNTRGTTRGATRGTTRGRGRPATTTTMAAALSAELRKARALTNKIQQIEPLRDQRNQAFRMLAAKGMTAGRIATEVGMTPAGVQRILHTATAKR